MIPTPDPFPPTSSAGTAAVTAEYRRRLEVRTGEVAEWDRAHSRAGDMRLALFLVSLLILGLAVFGGLHPAWVLLPGLPMLLAGNWMSRVEQKLAAARDGAAYWADGLARVEDRWQEGPRVDPGLELREKSHPYADDLDLFGPGSLFALLCRARSTPGRTALAAWLQRPDGPETVLARQLAVRALASNDDYREEVYRAAAAADRRFDLGRLLKWSGDEQPVRLMSRREACTRWMIAGLAAAYAMWTDQWLLLGPAGVVCAHGCLLYGDSILKAISELEPAGAQLDAVERLLSTLERGPSESEELIRLRLVLASHPGPAGVALSHLRRLRLQAGLLRNPFLATAAVLTMLLIPLVNEIEAWRRTYGPHLRRWVEAAGELEALCSVAAYAREHPDDTYPVIRSSGEAPCVTAEGLGHPLLPQASCVRNDLRVSGDRQLIIVSGSNMSGKSTLLRSLGLAVVMAQAGAPVRARGLELTPLAVATSLRISDSLQGGISHFYAELLRLKEILERTNGPTPVLFLVDEILHGTNSHDRRVGSEGYLRALCGRGAIGLVTTHDLALTRLSEEPGLAAVNCHFSDRILEDEGKAGGQPRIEFDYRLQPGVVEHSNALALMRTLGLPV